MKRLNFWLSLGLTLSLGLLLGLLGFSIWENIPTPVERVSWSQQAQWIAPQTPTYRFYARQTFNLPNIVEAGWLRLSADNDFTLYVNGQRVTGENSVLNNSLGLHGSLRVQFQDFNDSNRYRAKTSVNYLLASSQDWKLTNYVDIASYLRPGKNVVALEIQKGQQNPRVVVEGAVYPIANATPINLTTGASDWLVSNLSETHQSLRWFDLDFPDINWSQAQVLNTVQETTYSRLSKNLFEHFLQGNWITGVPSSQGGAWLRSIWKIPEDVISHAYIRFSGIGAYSLLLNGNLVNNYKTENGRLLHLVEVTKLLKPGNNILAVSLTGSLREAQAGTNSIDFNSSLGFFLDGWAETAKGEIIGAIATDDTWTSLNQPVSGWVEGLGDSQPVTFLGIPNAQQFRRRFEDDAYQLNYPNYLWRQSLWQLGGIVFAVVYTLLLGFWLRRGASWWDRLDIGAAILAPATLFLIIIGLIKHRYAEAELGLLFAQPQSNHLILVGFVLIVLLTLLLSQINSFLGKIPRWGLWFFCGIITFIGLGLAASGNVFLILFTASAITALTLFWRPGYWQTRNIYLVLQPRWQSWGQWFLLLLIVCIGLGLRVYDLGVMDLDADENTSFDASRGILRTGAPITSAGIWYTRGPFYQYLLALWLRIVGDSVINGRLLSVIWGTATLILIYIFAHQITGRVWIALLITAILAINPWELWYSRNIRFYQLLQFLTILSFWSFFRGFIDKLGKHYQYIFFIALTLTLLTQEISLTLLPVFIFGFLCFYRPFRISHDWQIILGSCLTLVIFVYCLGFSSIRLLTPLAAISDSTAAYLRLHFSDLTNLAAIFFINSDRMHTIHSLLFLLGFVYFLKVKNGKMLFLCSIIIINVIFITILCYGIAERYLYGVYPLFILLAVYSAICLAESLGNRLEQLLTGLLPLRAIALSLMLLLVVTNIEPSRTLAGFQESINRRNAQLFEYIRAYKQPGDVTISPLPPLAVVNLGKLDYFLMGTGYFDAAYWRDGRLIDRWSGAVVVSSIDKLNQVLQQHKRVWIHIEDTRKGRFKDELWQYVESLGQPVIDSFGTRLRLWQPEDGLPKRIANEGEDLGTY
ncbi:MAG: glycosyltransferase family 39 protein [Desmonostoc vinosum HA7617-LM4]|jgi:hypothetical protein|nr:glycosyltransferase family 39 protein [Desmonostoc vinosum HA7617-LM4]